MDLGNANSTGKVYDNVIPSKIIFLNFYAVNWKKEMGVGPCHFAVCMEEQ